MNKRKENLYALLTRCIFTMLAAVTAGIFAIVRELSVGNVTCGLFANVPGQLRFLPYYYTMPRSVEYIAAGVLLYLLFSAVLTAALNQADT